MRYRGDRRRTATGVRKGGGATAAAARGVTHSCAPLRRFRAPPPSGAPPPRERVGRPRRLSWGAQGEPGRRVGCRGATAELRRKSTFDGELPARLPPPASHRAAAHRRRPGRGLRTGQTPGKCPGNPFLKRVLKPPTANQLLGSQLEMKPCLYRLLLRNALSC